MKIKVFTGLLISFFLFSFSADACLNPIGPPFVGQKIEIEGISAADFIKSFTTHTDRKYWEDIRNANIKEQKEHPFIYYYSNNLAVALVHLGQVEDAIKILEETEKKFPRNYATASNLGTAYELNGENEKALKWIKEAVDRNKDSHLGTEWLHIKILEAKIAMEKDPDWIKNNHVLGVDFDADQTSQQQNLPTDYLGQQKTLNDVEDALIYQLHERLEFVKPPEPIVGNLLEDLSEIFATRRSPEYAKAISDLSAEYNGTPGKNNSPTLENNNLPKNNFIYIAVGAIVFIFVLVAYFYFSKRQKVIIKQ